MQGLCQLGLYESVFILMRADAALHSHHYYRRKEMSGSKNILLEFGFSYFDLYAKYFTIWKELAQ